jgi:hypothetical protein
MHLHYAQRQKKKGKDWCIEKVMISLEAIKTHNAHLHLASIFPWHQSSLRVPNMHLTELSIIQIVNSG